MTMVSPGIRDEGPIKIFLDLESRNTTGQGARSLT